MAKGKTRKKDEEIPPRFSQFETPDSSVADAIKKLTSADPQAVMVLANIDHADLARLALLKSISLDFHLDWLDSFLHSELSLSAAQKGLRSGQITEIARAPTVLADNSGTGILGKAKGILQR